MSDIYKINIGLPISTKISNLNDFALINEGNIEKAKYDLNELDQIFSDLGIDRQFLRNQSLGHTISNYTDWSHLKAETGYSIWKITPSDYTYNSLNKLYFDNKVLENRGEAGSESATAFDAVYHYDAESGGGIYHDHTTEAGTESGTEFELIDTISDYLYIGLDSTFTGIKFEFQTRGSYHTLKVEYYDETSGEGWTELTSNNDNLDDDTSNFDSDGKISWTAPSTWGITTINGVTKYWIRISTTTTPTTIAKAYYIIPYNSVPALLALSSTQFLNEDWAWCSYDSSIYVTIRNTGESAYEGEYHITSISSATNLKNFFVYNHEYTADYEDSTYSASGNFLIAGGSIALTGNLDLGYNKIINLQTPINPNDGANKSYVDAAIGVENLWDRESGATSISPYYSGDKVDMAHANIINLADPVNPKDATNKSYVDTVLAVENLWDRLSGTTTIKPYYDNDNVDLGSGDFVTTGSLGAGAITGTSFIIGGNTLDTNEWAFLDGLDQALKQADSPTFNDLTISTPSNIYSLSHDSFADFVGNKHINHSSVSIIAGTALTGGGDLTVNRTLNVDETIINHDNLSGFIANEHINWTGAIDNLITLGTGKFRLTLTIEGNRPKIELDDDTAGIWVIRNEQGDFEIVDESVSGAAIRLNLNSSGDLTIDGNIFNLGNGNPAFNKIIYANNGDANKPGIRYNENNDVWEFSNNGTVWATIGAGGGGDFFGPASATDHAIVRFDTTSGKLGQNSGVIIDDSNNVSGLVNITFTGHIIGGDATTQTQNLLLNGNFNYWYSGTAVAPDGWGITGGGSVAQESTEKPVNFTYSTKVTSDADGNQLRLTYNTVSGFYVKLRGKTLTFSCWVHADDASTVRLQIYGGTSTTQSSYHTGGGDWELLTVTAAVDTDSTNAQFYVLNEGNTKIIYAAGAMLVEGSAPFAYSPHPEDHLYEQETYWIGADAVKSESALTSGKGGVFDAESSYSYPHTVDDIQIYPFPLSGKINGKTRCIDEITLYYGIKDGDGATTNNADYIDTIYFAYNDLNSSKSLGFTHTGNLGDDTYDADQNHNLVDAMYEMTDYPHFFYMIVIQDTTITDIRIYGFKVKSHCKNHE